MTNDTVTEICDSDSEEKFSNNSHSQQQSRAKIFKTYLADNSDGISEQQQWLDKDGNSSLFPPVKYPLLTKKLTGRMLAVAMFSHLGVLSVGYDLGITSGAVLQVREEMSLSRGSQQILVAGTLPAAILMTLIGSYLSDKIGRRYTIMLASICYIFGAIMMASAFNLYMLLVGRLLVGMGTGLVSSSTAIMVAEFSPSQIRGLLVGINQPFLSSGILIATIIAGVFSYNKKYGWRYMWGLQALAPSIQLVGFFFLYDSPRWLMQKGRYKDSYKALAWVRNTKNVQREIQEIRNNCGQHKTKGNPFQVISKIIRTPSVRRALLVGCGIHFFSQFSGVNTVIYYSGIIVKSSGVGSNSKAIWNTAIINSCNLLFTFLGVWLVDKLGRRILGITSLIGIASSLVILGVSFQLADIYSPALNSTIDNVNTSCALYTSCSQCIKDSSCGYCYNGQNSKELGTCLPFNSTLRSSLGACSIRSEKMVWTYNYCPTSYSWLAILALALYLIFYAPGIGPLPWLVNSEIYPLWARSTGNGIAACVARTSNLIVSITFLSLSNAITMQGTYWLYSGMAVLGTLFIYWLLPELKGKTLEEIDNQRTQQELKQRTSFENED